MKHTGGDVRNRCAVFGALTKEGKVEQLLRVGSSAHAIRDLLTKIPGSNAAHRLPAYHSVATDEVGTQQGGFQPWGRLEASSRCN